MTPSRRLPTIIGSPLLALALLTVLVPPRPAPAQVAERMGEAAARAAEGEARRQVRRGVRKAIRCAVGDRVCERRARREGRDVVYVDASGRAVNGAGGGYWYLSFDDDRFEGEQGYVIRDEVVFALHLIADDDVSMYLFLAEAEEGDHDPDAVIVALDDEEPCVRATGSSAPFTVLLHRVDDEWVAGSYEGTVRCEDDPVEIDGTFRVPTLR